MARRHSAELSIINCSIDCATGICVQLVLGLLINVYASYSNKKIKLNGIIMLFNQYSMSNGVKQCGCRAHTKKGIYLYELIEVLCSPT